MGWKSTKKITREKAIDLIIRRATSCSDRELEEALEGLGFGEDTKLLHYGYNLVIGDEEDIEDEEDNENEED